MSMPETEHVLIIDDTPQIVRLLSHNLKNHGYAVSAATTGGCGEVNSP